MSSDSRRIPSYRRHKPSDQARVIISGRHIYLGKYGSPESWEKYHRIVADRLNSGVGTGVPVTNGHAASPALSVSEVLVVYWRFALGYYRKNGRPTGELDNLRAALRPLRQLYGSTYVQEFGPDSLEVLRSHMIDQGLSRKVINARVNRIKRVFRWASKKGLVPAATYHGLKAVEGLLRGRSKARETEPVAPVPDADVQAVLPHVTPQVQAMIQVQELAGMRPQDIRNMRTCDVDTSSDVWVYAPWTHKTEHHGHVRRIAIGPRAQMALRPYFKPEDPTAYLFSPKDAIATLRAKRARERKTPRTPSERAVKTKRNPKSAPGEQYTRTGYANAVKKACDRACVSRWSPNRLRHSCAVKVRKKYGIEGAAAVLGNSLGMVAEVYADSNFELAIKIMREIG